MHRYRFGIALLLGGWFAGGAPGDVGQRAVAQALSATSVAPATRLADEFASLAGRASVIFAGQVVRVEHRAGAVEITFQVEQAILGTPGAVFTLREWAGLWPQGQVRYTVGLRALVFLHGTSAAGYGSPVDGAEGVVPVLVQGLNAPELLDVRRLGAALLRPVGTPLNTAADGAIRMSDALPLIVAGLQLGNGDRAPRPEPVRLPMPTHSGLRQSLAGTLAAQAAAPVALPAEPLPLLQPTTLAGAGLGVQHGKR